MAALCHAAGPARAGYPARGDRTRIIAAPALDRPGVPMLRTVLLLALLALLAVAPLAAADVDWTADDSVEHSLGSDRFAAGRAVTITGPVGGDVFAAGGRVTVEGPVGGDAVLAGAHVEVRGPVERGLYAAGASVVVSGNVRHNARLAGGAVEVTPAAHFGGGLSMAGRTVSFAGTSDGYLQMAGRDATVSGTIGGDAEISAARIEIGPGAHIAGKLRYRSDREPAIAAGAQIVGGLERLPGTYREWSWRGGAHHALRGAGRALWWSGSFVLGVILLLLAPGYLTDTSRLAAGQAPLCLGLGFAILVAVPVAALLLLITLIGIPVALLAIALYATVLLVGHLVGAIALGDYALGRLAPARAAAAGWRVLGLLGALVALAVLRQVPLVGGLAVLLVFLAGIGALSLRAVRPRPPAAA
jgi:cytoskeletal protein CcmA (bactofilin family)